VVDMLYWVIYDIKANNVRSKIAGICKNYGMKRVQKSAFLGEITRNKIEMLSIETNKIIGRDDCIFVIPSCNSCFNGKMISGKFDEVSLRPRDFLVFGDGI